MKFAVLGLVAAAAAFGGQIPLDGGTSGVTFNNGTMTFSVPLSGETSGLGTTANWSISGTTFTYNTVTGDISTGNPVTFQLTAADDTLTGSVDLLNVADVPTDDAIIAGTLDVTGLTIGSSGLDLALYGALNAAAGQTITTGSVFDVSVLVEGCESIGGAPSACILTVDPHGIATTVTLTSAPEPATAGLLGCGLAGLFYFRRRWTARFK